MQRKPIGMPAPPARHYTDNYGFMVPNVKRNQAAERRWYLALSVCRLIADDRKAASFAAHQPDGIYWVRKDG